MAKHEYTFVRASWAGIVIQVNGKRPERAEKIWELVNRLGAEGWELLQIAGEEEMVWVVLHREARC